MLDYYYYYYIGTLPYSERLRELRLTTLAERRLRGDLIETFKIVNGLVDYGENIFRLSRSGSNIVSKCHIGEDASLRVKRLNSSFISEQVKSFWNHLPVSVKNSANVDMFNLTWKVLNRGALTLMRIIFGMFQGFY